MPTLKYMKKQILIPFAIAALLSPSYSQVTVSASDSAPSGSNLSQPNNSSNISSGVGNDVALARVIQWNSNQDIASVTFQDNNGQMLKTNLVLTFWSFADETAASNFSSPNQIAEFTGLSALPAAIGSANDDYITFSIGSTVGLTNNEWYAFGLSSGAGSNIAAKTGANDSNSGTAISWDYDLDTATADSTQQDRDLTFYTTAIPEPASLALLFGVAGLGMAVFRRR